MQWCCRVVLGFWTPCWDWTALSTSPCSHSGSTSVWLTTRSYRGEKEEEEGGGWLHADSQACHVCVPALKCHLEGRADGREAGRAGAAERSGTVGIARHGALILHGLPSISVHTQDIPSAWFSLKVDLCFFFLSPFPSSLAMLWLNTCAGFVLILAWTNVELCSQRNLTTQSWQRCIWPAEWWRADAYGFF